MDIYEDVTFMGIYMISAYYSRGCNSAEIFEKLKISSDKDYEKHLNKHNVIKIDLNSEYQNIRDKDNLINTLQEKIKAELINEYSEIAFKEEDSLGESLLKVYENRRDTFIILIDEYDVLVREQVKKEIFDEYLSFLNGLIRSDPSSHWLILREYCLWSGTRYRASSITSGNIHF